MLCEDVKNNIDILDKVVARLFNNKIIQNIITPGIGLPYQLFRYKTMINPISELIVIAENF